MMQPRDPSEEDMHKTSPYVRTVVTLHNLRDKAKDAVDSLQDINLSEKVHDSWNRTQTAVTATTRKFCTHPDNVILEHIPQDYGYVFRPKSCWELVLLGGTVCGIEFCYSAETAFVTPILLSLGLNIKFVTMIWCLSPLIGLFLTPILGSMSDSCESRIGRRRPFILLYSIGILIGLILVPNGHLIGLAIGDHDHVHENQLAPNNISIINKTNPVINNRQKIGITRIADMPAIMLDDRQVSNESVHFDTYDADVGPKKKVGIISGKPSDESRDYQTTSVNSSEKLRRRKRYALKEDQTMTKVAESNKVPSSHIQPWSIAFTVIGTMLLDFCSDACQSPSRTYMLDVSLPDDHAAGLSTFTIMAGFGGSVGYLMGAIQWENTFLGHLLGGQVSVVFTIVTVVFVICLITTICSFPEIPLSVLRDPKMFKEYQERLQVGNCQFTGNEMAKLDRKPSLYGATEQNNGFGIASEKENSELPSPENVVTTENDMSTVPELNIVAELTTASQHPTITDFLKSIVRMPRSLKILCLTNLFCWMSLVCYSLYFTDFVAECVFGGDPQAPDGSESSLKYKDGVRFGCWGMALYSLSCAIYSYFIEALIKKIGAKSAYIGGQMVYSLGMVIMAATRHKVAVILLSPTAGVMYATLFTMPYLLIAHYHSTNKFCDEKNKGSDGVRGIGTDVAAVSSMVFLSQFILSMSMGSIVEAVGSNVATVGAASILSACGALSASQVMYLNI